MKILMAHNYYRSSAPSGEDAVFRNEKEMLEKNGESIILYEQFNDDIDESTFSRRVKLALDGAWSKKTYAEIRALIEQEKPDIAHFHNTFPLISPSAYAACQDAGVPVVQTIHNYRFICPGALLLRGGHPCEDCVGGSLANALYHKCYRGSFPATLAQVWTIASNRWRGTYKNNINRYIALTGFARGRLVAGGIPAQKITVKPNFLPSVPEAGTGRGGYAVYVGRLSEEKGVRTLLAAWENIIGLPLKVLGDGPLSRELENESHIKGLNIEFLGYRSRDEILAITRNAMFQVVPSEWYEGFPMVILEAYACGTPVIASRIGSLDEIIKDGVTGLKFEPGNADDLAARIHSIQNGNIPIASIRANARSIFDENYVEESNYRMLMRIYKNVIDGITDYA